MRTDRIVEIRRVLGWPPLTRLLPAVCCLGRPLHSVLFSRYGGSLAPLVANDFYTARLRDVLRVRGANGGRAAGVW